MDRHTPESLFERAAARTRERMRQDREGAPEKVRELLAYAEDHLFDSDFNVARWLAVCRPQPRHVRQLKAGVGRRPKEYLLHRKMQTADWLLRHTDLELPRLAKLLGWSAHIVPKS